MKAVDMKAAFLHPPYKTRSQNGMDVLLESVRTCSTKRQQQRSQTSHVLVGGVVSRFGFLEAAMLLGLGAIFLLGIFLGSISGHFWLFSGLRTLVIAIATSGVIILCTPN